MKKLIRDLFKEESGKWSFTRLFVILPIISIGIYEIFEYGNDILKTTLGCAILIISGCFGRFFNRFIDNGSIEKIIDAFSKRIGKRDDSTGSK